MNPNHRTDFRSAIRAAGMFPPGVIEPERFYRFPGVGKSAHSSAGWCKLFADRQGGVFGDFSTGMSESWFAGSLQAQTSEEHDFYLRNVKQAMAMATDARKAEQDEAASEAMRIWKNASPAPHDHAYLTCKGIRPYGVRVYRGDLKVAGLVCDGALLVPIRNVSGDLRSLQFIVAKECVSGGEKRFLRNGERKACYHMIGTLGNTICIVEGYATGVSVHDATGHAVAIAFDAGNLEPVARRLHEKFPDSRLIVCADDDFQSPGNPGLTKAAAAANAVDGLVAIPTFGDSRPAEATDFNDVGRLLGADAVKRAISEAKVPDALTSAHDLPLETPMPTCQVRSHPLSTS